MTALLLVALHHEDRTHTPWLPYAARPGSVLIDEVTGEAVRVEADGRVEPARRGRTYCGRAA